MITAAIWNATVVNDALYLKGFEVPSGIIGVFDADCPTGWTRLAGWDGMFVRGAASYGATGGAGLHSHTGPAHTHTTPVHHHNLAWGAASYTYAAPVVFTSADNKSLLASTGGGSARGVITLVTNGSGTSGSTGGGAWGDGSNNPEFVDVVFCKKN